MLSLNITQTIALVIIHIADGIQNTPFASPTKEYESPFPIPPKICVLGMLLKSSDGEILFLDLWETWIHPSVSMTARSHLTRAIHGLNRFFETF